MLQVNFVVNGALCECHFPPQRENEAAIQAAVNWALEVPNVLEIITDLPFDPDRVTARNTIPIEISVIGDGLFTYKVTIY